MHRSANDVRHARAGRVTAMILTLQTILFCAFYRQMSTSLTLFGVPLFTWSAAPGCGSV